MSTEPHGYRALGPILDNPVLGIFAETLDDLEKIRCASENRLRALTDTSELGHGLDLRHPDVAYLAASVEQMKAAEHQAILNLQRVMRKHPLWAWAKPLRGVGEKQFARLLASIGDPYWNDLHNRPRKLSELRAYCGFHVIQTTGSQAARDAQLTTAAGSTCHPDNHRTGDPHGSAVVGVAPKRQRGQKSNWNEDARKRTWLIATSCLKQPAGTRYRDIYDLTRIKYADAVHQTDCVRCGPAGKPAPAGSPLSLGHQHARGLRAISKALLADMWREAKRIHESAADGDSE